MRVKSLWLIPVILSLSGIFLVGYYLFQPVTLVVNNSLLNIRTTALTVDAIIQSAGIPVFAGDAISPERSSLLLDNQPIVVKNGSSVAIWIDGQRITAYSNERYPANLLLKYGVRLFPGDILTIDGKRSSPIEAFKPDRYHTIQYRSWISDNNLLAAQAASFDTTVGIKLASEGRALMGLDYSAPAEDQPVTAETVQVQRVSDEILLEQKVLPFEYKTIVDDQVELDQQTVTQTGEYGLSVELTRIRSVNGTEASRKTISSTTINPPVNQILSLGTKTVVKQMAVGGSTIEYWRAVSMYATSYSPCHSGTSECSYGTASGAKAGKGIVAVVSRWFPYMRGQQVYIPGYGFATIDDTGGGIPGTTWIDLGYNDADYIPWHSWVTVYFLTPIPSNILYNLN
jgi:resuscitation-promoting factor RpfB